MWLRFSHNEAGILCQAQSREFLSSMDRMGGHLYRTTGEFAISISFLTESLQTHIKWSPSLGVCVKRGLDGMGWGPREAWNSTERNVYLIAQYVMVGR